MLAKIPRTALLTVDNIPVKHGQALPDATVHALLASFLTVGDQRALAEYETWRETWRETWPTRADVRHSMLLAADDDQVASIADFLPPGVIGRSKTRRSAPGSPQTSEPSLLEKQRQRLAGDWNAVLKSVPESRYGDFVYFWLLVNSRSFFFDLAESFEPQTRDDRIALCPWLDYFNHSDRGVGGAQG